MSTVKISELPLIPHLNQDTTQTLLPAVDLETGVTGKLTAKVLADTLYANNVLNVGNNDIIFPGVVAQFVGDDESYLQVNIQNINANGSTDLVLTADDGTDETYFIDIGIQGSTAPLGALQPHDGYLIVQGDDIDNSGNLVIGTSSGASGLQLKFVAGGYEEDNVYAVFETTQAHFLNNVVVDGTITGATITAMDNYSTAGFNRTNSAFLTANSAGSFANGAFLRANGSASFANGAFTAANSVAESVSSINLTLLSTQNYANGGFTQANAASSFANGAFTQANSASSYANGAFTKANSAAEFANSAFSKANNALANTTGTFAGDLTIAGNLIARSITTSNLISFAGSSTPITNALVEIIGSVGGAQVTPATDGYMLHVTGKDGVSNKIVFDSFGTGAYPLVAGRSARGSANTPLSTQNNDVLMRVSSGGYGNTGFIATGSAKIDFVAAENFTDATRGTEIQFWNTIPGTNTLNKIVTFNATHAQFSGYIMPDKGFIYTPRIPVGNQTAITINYASDSMIKANLVADLTISHSNFVSGKIVEMWLVNSGGLSRTVTHGLAAINSTTNSTTITIPSTSSMHLKFFSIDGDLANTFVAVTPSV